MGPGVRTFSPRPLKKREHLALFYFISHSNRGLRSFAFRQCSRTICTVKSMHQENECKRSSIGYACLMPEFTKVWSVANIALIKLTAKLASSVHFVQSSCLIRKIVFFRCKYLIKIVVLVYIIATVFILIKLF